MRIKVEITGMHCPACQEAIKTAVAPLPGVTRCEVGPGGADLVFDEALTSVARVLESIRGAGPFEIASFNNAE